MISSDRQRVRAACFAAGICTFTTSPLFAADFAYEVSAGAGHSDNITRVEVGEQDENIGLLGLRLSLSEQTARTEADVRGNVSYYEYLDDTYDSEVLGNLAADARFALVSDRLLWTVSDYFGQVLQDPFQASTPDNRENINQFATGPDLTLAFGSQMQMRLSGRYIATTYEDSPLDSETLSAGLGLIRSLSQASALSLNAEAQQTEYDEAALGADYDQTEVFARYSTEGARTTLSVDVGHTEIESDTVGASDDGLLLRLDLARRISAASVLTLAAGREFANSGSAFASAQGMGSVDLGVMSGQQTAQPFRNDYTNVGWNYSRNRTGLSLALMRNEQTYETASQFDQTLVSANALLTRQMSQRATASLGVVYTEGSFEQPDGDYDEIGGTVSLSWNLSERLSLNASYDRWRRNSQQANGDYVENRIWLTLAYGNDRVRSTAVQPEFAIDQGLTP